MHQEQCIKVICKGDLLSDAAAVEIPSGLVRAVNCLPYPQADVSLVGGSPSSTSGIVQESDCSEGILGLEAVTAATVVLRRREVLSGKWE